MALFAITEVRRLLSLWDIMNLFNAAAFANVMTSLQSLSWGLKFISKRGDQAGGIKADALVKLTTPHLEAALGLCKDAQFKDAVQQIEITKLRLENPPVEVDVSRLDAEIEHVLMALLTELCNQRFLLVQKDRSDYLDQDALFGPDVARAFPSARSDLREAGNCLAAECSTACVFHLMRAVEWALRALCADLGFRRIRRKNRRTGKVTHVSIEYADWETMLNQLQSRVDDKLAKLKRGQNKHALQVFYFPALQDIKAIRDAWRNHIMHTRAEYTRTDAMAILDHVRRLMRSLSERISEY